MGNKIIEIIAEILKLDVDALMIRFDDKTVWDSMQRVEIFFAIEDEFDMQFNEKELAILATPKKLYEFVLERTE